MMRQSSRDKVILVVVTIILVEIAHHFLQFQKAELLSVGERRGVLQDAQGTVTVSSLKHIQPVRQQNDDLGEAMYAVRVVRSQHEPTKGREGGQLEVGAEESVEEKVENVADSIPAQEQLPFVAGVMDMTPEPLTCQVFKGSTYFVKSDRVDTKMTISLCHSYCLGTNSTFMALTNGDRCICTNQHGEGSVLKTDECNVTCSGDMTSRCGGVDSAMFYRIYALDGDKYWTSWSRYTISKGKEIWTRYRGCPIISYNTTVCSTVNVQRDFYQVTDSDLSNHYIGCFSSGSFEDLSSPFIQSVNNLASATLSGYSRCLESCRQTSAAFYAVVTREKCLCTSSLGWSQTTEACTYGVGVLVYSIKPLVDSRVTLRFEGRRTEKNVAVIAHYRGGSTVASAMFSVRKGSLSAFELDKLLGNQWPGVSIMGREEQRSRIYLTKILPAWFTCNSYNMPAKFYKLLPKDVHFYFGFDTIMSCLNAVRNRKVATICGAFLREKCLMSPIVSAKTVRILHAGAIRDAITQYPHIQFVHTLRDPRAMHASRASVNLYFKKDIANRIKDSCWELVELYKSLEVGTLPNNIHILHYEDLATDLIATATNIYREMNMTLTEEISKYLHKMMGEGAERISNYDIVQEHPKARINGWTWYKKRYLAIEEADGSEECSAMFRYYKQYYKPLRSLLEQDSSPWEQQ